MPDPARIVICAPAKLPTLFPDDVTGTCSLCHQPVRFRPHVPARRVLICMECYIVHAEPGAQCELLGDASDELDAIGLALPKW